MTSSMSPEIAIRWLEDPTEFKKKFPMSLRPQSHDIIRTWAFYTILKSYLHFNSIPWKDIAIGTYVLDSKGHGMHKSKGNAVWVEDLLNRYQSVDIVRYWVGTATFGDDLPFQEKDLVAGQKFLTKLWNASKFTINHLHDYKNKKPKLEAIDTWLLSKLNEVIEQTTKAFMEYRTGDAKRIVEHFFWHTFCDNYLEIAKDRLYNPDKRGKSARESAQYTLYQTLLTLLKLISPIIPHITEEIYQSHFKKHEKDKSIHISAWPKYDKTITNKKLEETGDIAVDIVSKVRQFKAKNNRSLKEEVKLTIEKKYKEKLKPFIADIKAATCAKELLYGKFSVEF